MFLLSIQQLRYQWDSEKNIFFANTMQLKLIREFLQISLIDINLQMYYFVWLLGKLF